MIKEQMAKQAEYNENIMKIQGLTNPNILHHKLNEQTFVIQQLSLENSQLKEKLSYLEDKIKQLISEKINYLKSKCSETNT
jgi:predicted nuclease with TOPRIM domain